MSEINCWNNDGLFYRIRFFDRNGDSAWSFDKELKQFLVEKHQFIEEDTEYYREGLNTIMDVEKICDFLGIFLKDFNNLAEELRKRENKG